MTKLSEALPGTWRLISRIDVDRTGLRRPEPALGEDPVALLIYDRAGHFAAQFMRRDRSGDVPEATAGGNNSRAVGGYDAYFGDYSVDDVAGAVTQRLTGALSAEHVGAVLIREMSVADDRLVITLQTSQGEVPVTRTLTWERVG